MSGSSGGGGPSRSTNAGGGGRGVSRRSAAAAAALTTNPNIWLRVMGEGSADDAMPLSFTFVPLPRTRTFYCPAHELFTAPHTHFAGHVHPTRECLPPLMIASPPVTPCGTACPRPVWPRHVAPLCPPAVASPFNCPAIVWRRARCPDRYGATPCLGRSACPLRQARRAFEKWHREAGHAARAPRQPRLPPM